MNKYVDPAFWSNQIKRARYRGHYSNFSEQEIIAGYIRRFHIDEISHSVVDIGASDGMRRSNTLGLFEAGWSGIAFEPDDSNAAKMRRAYKYLDNVEGLQRAVSPENVSRLLSEHLVAKRFGVLSLDIDGNDYWVLEAVLREFRPCLIVSEYNEKIPPPISFVVKYDPEFRMGHHFFGFSLAKLRGLLAEFDYAILEVEYNNVFLAPAEIAKDCRQTIAEAYKKGYADRPDRKTRFPQNANMELLQNVGPEEGVRFLNDFYREHEGKYELSIDSAV